jgi:hypothetical protein
LRSLGVDRFSAGRNLAVSDRDGVREISMSEQDSTSDDALADVAAENGPAAPAGERPSAGAERRTDPAESNPAANQRAGEQEVEQPAAKDTVANTAAGAHRPGAPSGEVAAH